MSIGNSEIFRTGPTGNKVHVHVAVKDKGTVKSSCTINFKISFHVKIFAIHSRGSSHAIAYP